jgi:putative ABC transport system permease protein
VRFRTGCAHAADLRSLVIGETVRLIGLALLAGGALALGGGRILETLRFGVTSSDWMTFGITSIVLVIVALAASYAPTRRAMRVDRVLALRTE